MLLRRLLLTALFALPLAACERENELGYEEGVYEENESLATEEGLYEENEGLAAGEGLYEEEEDAL